MKSFFIRAVIGNIASWQWFFPSISKFLHQCRGVSFADRKTAFISRGVILDNRYPEPIFTGEDVWLTQNVAVLSHSYASRLRKKLFFIGEKVAGVRIERGVFIGLGSVILPGVVLGESRYIGAGSVVTHSIPPGVLATGNPCGVLRHLRKDHVIE